MQTAIQACIDIGDQILAWEGADEPPRSRDVFPALSDVGRLDSALAYRLADLVGLRNSLVHHYVRITRADVERSLPEVIGAASGFAEMAADWLAGPAS